MAQKRKKAEGNTDPRRNLPSVSVLLEQPRVQALIVEHTRPLVLGAIDQALGDFRRTLKPGDAAPDIDATVDRVEEALLHSVLDRIRPVVNATGIILHTGLGRAVLPKAAAAALAKIDRCHNLQMDLETGLRGKRNYMSEQLVCKLTGAEAAMVVNNNAGATLLILAALCKDKEVVVSRGQLIEIGGSYRLPDCIHQSGAVMVEVGTTNKTHLRDYEQAITENTGALLRVNPSNYRVIGFAQDVPVAELVTLKKDRDLLVIDDLGCGALIDTAQFGLPHEPTAPDSVAAGADLVCFSGDKMIGGPQAGIIVGRGDLIARIRKHPLTRMLRVGKMTDVALETTLRLFLEPETLRETNPTIGMIAAAPAQLKRRAIRLKNQIVRQCPSVDAQVRQGESATGGGSLPATPLPTHVVAVTVPGMSAETLAMGLRKNEPPVIARIVEDEVLLDVRTMLDGDDRAVVDALAHIAGQGQG